MNKLIKGLSGWQKPGRALSKIYSAEYPPHLQEYPPIRFDLLYREYARYLETLAVWEDEGGALRLK
ncbi:MAG: hypothetical protein H6510_01865 [Acidobacteria bacterium]|nr:hypothetical protein [Acidobacteriota bacterium]MCB9396538.1 hypothetical protein [Acidobacteriota bacterium]